jgi:growth factor-regulated tyrosine kinase substrate
LFATLIDRMQSSPPGAILREPRIQELYEAVSALKPKLGRTLSSVVGTYGIPLFRKSADSETLVDMHAKLNTVVRYYDKMLEDRLATTYSHATYQEARPPTQSPMPYQYNLPPQSPSSPSHQSQGYFPSRRSTFSEQVNVPPAVQSGQESSYYGPSQPPSQYPSNPNWSNGTNVPPFISPVAGKAPYVPQYAEPHGYQYGHPAPAAGRPSLSDVPPSSPQQPRQRLQGDYPPYGEQESYYQAPPQRREDSSLIDL